jgi:hypothetical protein
VEILLPEEARLFDVYGRIEKAVDQLEQKFKNKYVISDITVGVSITASISPSFTGSISATLTKR